MPDVLFVEDDAVVRHAAERICDAAGLTIEMEETVDAAITRLEKRRYGLVLADLMLPKRPGFDLLELLAAEPASPPVVMVTGYATLDNALRSFELGAFDFIPKPFDVDELLGVVKRGLRWGEQRSAMRSPSATESAADRFFLGRHAWAYLDQRDGTATLGVAETFSGVVGELERVELPERQAVTLQGKQLARLEDKEKLVYRVWSPLSGRVLAVNKGVLDDPRLLDREPFGAGWLVRIIPAKQDEELLALSNSDVRAGAARTR